LSEHVHPLNGDDGEAIEAITRGLFHAPV
jgi:hypothetical protein